MLGVAGSIAAYKAAEILRGLVESGLEVTVVPTASALRFVGEATWAALSGRPVPTLWSGPESVEHVRLGQQADCIVVAPATADLLARAAHGMAGDLLENTLLTARCPVLLAPAMHTEMWQHPATQANVALLRGRGTLVLEPASGRLTGADSGPGRLPEPSAIVDSVRDLLRRGSMRDLDGLHVLVTAGGTREPLDPVRYIGNISSGRQGYALARTAATRGAHVTLISAHAEIGPPAGVTVVRTQTAAQMRDAVLAASAGADVVVMAAAVADFRPTASSEHKIKKDDSGTGLRLDLEQTDDILAALVKQRSDAGQVIVGFAAETSQPGRDPLALGAEKLMRKGCDLLVVNDVSGGAVFGEEQNEAVVLWPDGRSMPIHRGDKAAVADRVWDAVAERLGRAAPLD